MGRSSRQGRLGRGGDQFSDDLAEFHVAVLRYGPQVCERLLRGAAAVPDYVDNASCRCSDSCSWWPNHNASPTAPAAPAEVLRLAAALARAPGPVRRLARNDGHSLPVLAALATLDRVGPVRVGELAERENVSQPAMTQLVSRLHARGLVDRQPDPADGRVAVVALTGAGRDLVAALHEARARVLADQLMRADPADRGLLIAALPALERLLTGD